MTADRVVLLRHGRTASNAAGIWQGQLDVPLDDVGIDEAGRAARTLASLPPARIVASDLSRAAATAAAEARPFRARGSSNRAETPSPTGSRLSEPRFSEVRAR